MLVSYFVPADGCIDPTVSSCSYLGYLFSKTFVNVRFYRHGVTQHTVKSTSGHLPGCAVSKHTSKQDAATVSRDRDIHDITNIAVG